MTEIDALRGAYCPLVVPFRRTTRRVAASQATSRPCKSRVIPFAALVFSLKTAIACPGAYFQRLRSVP
jgi:hypothetical protein